MRSFRAFAHVPLRALYWAGSALAWAVSRPMAAYWWLRALRVDLWTVEGEEKGSGLPLSIACALSGENKKYMLALIFGNSYRERSLGRVWLWTIAAAAPAPSHSLVLVEVDESHIRFVEGMGWFLIPNWVLGKVELPRDAGALRKVSRNLRRLRRHDFRFEVTRDPRLFDDFYHNMYLPYIAQRFGDGADISSYEYLKAGFDSCELLLVKDQDTSIAGQLILYEPRGPHLWEMGVRDGNRDYVAGGAVGSAVFHFSLEYLQDNGHTKAWLGWSRPFLRDGVLQFKRSWSQRIADNGNRRFALKVLSPTPAAQAFLCNNPFVFKSGDCFFGAVFVAGDAPLVAEDIVQIDKDYFHDGLSRLFIYPLGSQPASMPDGVPAEIAAHIEVCCAEHMPGLSPDAAQKSLESP